MSSREIKKVIEVDASPEVVFKAISDPKELTNWFPDAAILEPHSGGKFKLSFFKDSNKSSNKNMEKDCFPEGKVLEFIPSKKLVYTWQHSGIPETIVTWELEPIGKNKTKVTLTHTGFTGKEGDMFEEHNNGWAFHLNGLISYCKKK
jgi:uncharacterized protein YndB with AHSA1/START domain